MNPKNNRTLIWRYITGAFALLRDKLTGKNKDKPLS